MAYKKGLIVFIIAMLTGGFAFPEDDEPITRLYKGQGAPYDGALMNFNTLKDFVEVRNDYEIMRKDYLDYGKIEKPDAYAQSDKIAFQVVMILGAGLLGAGCVTDSGGRGALIAVGSAITIYSFINLNF